MRAPRPMLMMTPSFLKVDKTSECREPFSNFGADLPESDNPNPLASQRKLKILLVTLASWIKKSLPHIPIRSRNSPEHIDQQSDSQIGNILGVRAADVGDGDSPAPVLGLVDLIDACASHDDHSQRLEQPEELDVDYGAAVSEQDEDGGRVRSEELVQRLLGFPGFEDSELNSDGKRAIAGDRLIIRTRGHRSPPWKCWIWASSAIAELKSSWICQKADFTEKPAGMKVD
ncbi:hypothetical protein TIFTF001_026998 [Ficus carica]|uniref:Uncharacterized protein n=1 Tax=Ficus carica TaxID=3494 RepID=A0AA88DM88_FICCA|nr:hypothetical protein TIFTF001_026998 [Ficus carica]